MQSKQKHSFEARWKATRYKLLQRFTDGKAGNSSTNSGSAWSFLTNTLPLFSEHLRKTQLTINKLFELSEKIQLRAQLKTQQMPI